jgi:ADP-heptose:LPS heptosyltransferase
MEDGILTLSNLTKNTLESKNTKILIIQLRQLGDVLLTTPLTRQVRNKYPNAQIHFVTEKLGANIYRDNQYIDQLIILPNKLTIFALFKYYYFFFTQRYDIVIDAFGNPKSAQFTYFSRAPKRIGFSFLYRKYAYTNLIESHKENEYSAITKLRLISELNPDLSDFKLDFPISDQEKVYGKNFFQKNQLPKNTIAFHVVSRRDYKIWESNKFIELANWMIKNNFTLLFTYGPGEYDLAKDVYNKIENKAKAIIDYDLPNLQNLKGILENCLCYIGNDGGVKHIAITANIPTFTIFKDINFHNWTPPESTKHMAVSQWTNKVTFTSKQIIENLKIFFEVNNIKGEYNEN